MYPQWKLLPLAHLGVLRACGRDVVAFLQGQLSADLAALTRERSLLAGCHNPQGRVLALMRLFEREPGEVLALLPRELIGPIVARLRGFVLRSRVELTDESAAWRIEGLVGPDTPAEPAPAFASQLPQAPGAVLEVAEARVARVDSNPPRWLIVSSAAAVPGDALPGLAECAPADSALWQGLAVAHGQPEVYAATSGEFVAQMLNLDVLGAIAFDKGCYTGQEVIARAHYRGRVKRRLRRFGSAVPLPLAVGAAGTLADGRSVRIVEVAPAEGGGCEFLAVAPGETAPGEPPAAAATLRLEATPLPLPYELPE